MNGHNGQVVGYVRVSAIDQNEAREVQALGEVERLFSEKVNGKNVDDREQLKELLQYVRGGDLVRVKSPDRLSRSTRDLLSLVEQLQDKGVEMAFVDNPSLNTKTPQGTFMVTVLGAVAELERATIRERQAKGVYVRQPNLNAEKVEEAGERFEAGVSKAVGRPGPRCQPVDDLHRAGR